MKLHTPHSSTQLHEYFTKLQHSQRSLVLYDLNTQPITQLVNHGFDNHNNRRQNSHYDPKTRSRKSHESRDGYLHQGCSKLLDKQTERGEKHAKARRNYADYLESEKDLMIWLTWPFACASLLPKFRAEKSITIWADGLWSWFWLAIFT